MNPLLYGFYQLVKLIVRLAFRIFYPYKIYLHPERLRFDYPAILVSNHPNTLIDPLTVAAKTKKLVFFLANAGLFSSRFGHWFFNKFFCIPVQRPQDKGGNRPISNEDSFSRANDHLINGGVLYIAPEGGSETGRRLRPLKTGAARIALSTEKKQDYKLGMAIVPVGLTYYRPDQCGSRLVVQVGEPIFPQKYREADENNHVQAVRNLTADLKNRLGALLINTQSELEDQRLRMLEAIRQNDKPLSGESRFRREMSLLQDMRAKADDELFTLLDRYRVQLLNYRIKDSVVGKADSKSFSLWILLAIPVYLYGLINNFFAAKIPVWLSQKLDLYEGYTATVKIISALITIPLFYWLQTQLVSWYFGAVFTWPYLISLPVSGILYWRLARRFRAVERAWRYRRLAKSSREELQQLRNDIKNREQIIGF